MPAPFSRVVRLPPALLMHETDARAVTNKMPAGFTERPGEIALFHMQIPINIIKRARMQQET